jgi:hypothetical protein
VGCAHRGMKRRRYNGPYQFDGMVHTTGSANLREVMVQRMLFRRYRLTAFRDRSREMHEVRPWKSGALEREELVQSVVQ